MGSTHVKRIIGSSRKKPSWVTRRRIQVRTQTCGKGFGLQIPNKVKNLLWRACRGAMPTKEALVRLTIIEDPLCNCCHATHETPLHALWLCKELETVWERTAHCQARQDANFLNFKELLSWILRESSKVELFAMIAWGIWNQRNQAWLNHAAASLHQIFQISEEKLAEFTACQPSATPMLCKTGQSQN